MINFFLKATYFIIMFLFIVGFSETLWETISLDKDNFNSVFLLGIIILFLVNIYKVFMRGEEYTNFYNPKTIFFLKAIYLIIMFFFIIAFSVTLWKTTFLNKDILIMGLITLYLVIIYIRFIKGKRSHSIDTIKNLIQDDIPLSSVKYNYKKKENILKKIFLNRMIGTVKSMFKKIHNKSFTKNDYDDFFNILKENKFSIFIYLIIKFFLYTFFHFFLTIVVFITLIIVVKEWLGLLWLLSFISLFYYIYNLKNILYEIFPIEYVLFHLFQKEEYQLIEVIAPFQGKIEKGIRNGVRTYSESYLMKYKNYTFYIMPNQEKGTDSKTVTNIYTEDIREYDNAGNSRLTGTREIEMTGTEFHKYRNRKISFLCNGILYDYDVSDISIINYETLKQENENFSKWVGALTP